MQTKKGKRRPRHIPSPSADFVERTSSIASSSEATGMYPAIPMDELAADTLDTDNHS